MQQAAYVWVEDLERKIVDTLEHNERCKIISPIYMYTGFACTYMQYMYMYNVCAI